MKKLTILAALLMTTSYAYAGNNSISFEINGNKISIEAPQNCDQLSCIRISGVDFSGLNSKSPNDDAAANPDSSSQPPAPAPAPAAEATAPQAPIARPAPPAVSATEPAPTTPVGVWNTEDNKGQVRIESCGLNLCGYAVKTGEAVLINMKPLETKWTGTIHDPNSGSNYNSTIAMKGANSLQVRGCAFGGMFCGGQVWNRAS